MEYTQSAKIAALSFIGRDGSRDRRPKKGVLKMINRIKKLLALPERPWTVCADKRTAAYLVYDKNGDFHDDCVTDERANFIQTAINNHESLYDALLSDRTVILWALSRVEDDNDRLLFKQKLSVCEDALKKADGEK
jgi:hypothetical protein